MNGCLFKRENLGQKMHTVDHMLGVKKVEIDR